MKPDLHGREDGTSADFLGVMYSVPIGLVKLKIHRSLGGTQPSVLPAQKLDVTGYLRLRATLSYTMTGTKSFFLKALDPFFNKDGSGTVIPDAHHRNSRRSCHRYHIFSKNHQ
jgi:hypothetical protein